jgi:hypothetical protein
MCWNKEVSIISGINSYIIAFYLYLRNYKYDRWYSIFIFTFSSIQFCDFLLWSDIENNINNTNNNKIISKYIIPTIIALEPLSAYFGKYLTNEFNLKTDMNNNFNRIETIIYIIFALIMFKTFSASATYTTLTTNNSLNWGSVVENDNVMYGLIFALFLMYPFIKIKNRPTSMDIIIFGIIFSYAYSYHKTDTWGSNWCLYGNFFTFAPLIAPYID